MAAVLLAAAPSVTFDLSGNGAAWHAVVSKSAIGKSNGTTFYRWAISVFNGSALEYQSPRDGGPLTKVTKAHGAEMWFPAQEASIVGAASLMGTKAQQLVVASHETGADCGAATITVFGVDGASGKVLPMVTVRNGCELTAKIVGTSIQLSGPYYNASAAMCCPTKPQATATLRYAGGKWTESPQYYALYPNAFPSF
ncbi:MAG TPA: hypothetical protein VGN11_02660 [Candidatus Baltobacteraceae bacterium]|nr:hypothetical protein [Candidatus Baltobacteraceae bacterium]